MSLGYGVESVLRRLGSGHSDIARFCFAEQTYLQCLNFFKELGSRGTMTTLLTRLALLEEQRGNDSEALEYAAEALSWSQRLDMVEEQAMIEALHIRISS